MIIHDLSTRPILTYLLTYLPTYLLTLPTFIYSCFLINTTIFKQIGSNATEETKKLKGGGKGRIVTIIVVCLFIPSIILSADRWQYWN